MAKVFGPVVGGPETKQTVALSLQGAVREGLRANLAKLEAHCRKCAIDADIFQQRVFSDLPQTLIFTGSTVVQQRAVDKIGEHIYRTLFQHNQQ